MKKRIRQIKNMYYIQNFFGWNTDKRISFDNDVSSEFTCKCSKMKGWITEGKKTEPCPECGRVYIGYYDKKNLTIDGIDINEINESNAKRELLTKIGLNYERGKINKRKEKMNDL